MRPWWLVLGGVVIGAAVPFACSGDETGGGKSTTSGSTATGGGAGWGAGAHGATTAGGATGSGAGGAASGGAAGSATGAAGTGGEATGGGATGGGATGGGVTDAGPDVTFSYDAGGGDGAVSQDSACAADVVKAEKLPVDIIWAIDTSGSMGTEIAQVKANINGSFADVLAQGALDYRVTMIAAKGTSSLQVCVSPPLGGPNCGDNFPIFHASAQSVASTNALSLILSTYQSTDPAIEWASFLRYDALKVFVIVTDDNSSLAAASFDSQLLAKTPAGMFGTTSARRYRVYGIIGIDKNNPAVKCPQAVNNGSVYQQLIAIAGGGMYSECEADYSPIFKQMANSVVSALSCEYAMPQAAADGGAVDPNNVQLKFTSSLSVETIFPRVNDLNSCNGPGWYYDNNVTPTKLILCPAACAQVQADTGGKVDILVGCLTG